jgi:NAD-dependent SIR2 family protein deacetylase
LTVIEHHADFPPEFREAFRLGKLVFFCGAGVSNYGKAVPDYYHSFENLTAVVLNHFDRYKQLEKTSREYRRFKESIEYKWYKEKRYDHLLQRLTEKYPILNVDSFIKNLFQDTINTQLREFLETEYGERKYNVFNKGLFQKKLDLSQHRILLNLARQNPNGHIRIVTTNFDTLFTQALKALEGDETIHEFYAPRLPIPRDKNFPNSVTYLHGGVGDSMPEKHWVYTLSGFGKAYIGDGWAARFITELARNHDICFVGYGVNDPIMRYIFSGIKAVNEENGSRPSNKVWSLFVPNPKLSAIKQRHERDSLEVLGLDPLEFESYNALWSCLNTWHEYNQLIQRNSFI